MPIISQRATCSRRAYPCDGCQHEGPDIQPGEMYARLYGYAQRGDPPLVLRLCADCVRPLKIGANIRTNITVSLPPRPEMNDAHSL